MDQNKLENLWAARNKYNYIPFGIFAAGTNLDWIEDNGGGGTGGAPQVNDLTAQVTGSNNTYTLTGSPIDANHVQLVYNGMVCRRLDATFGYSVLGAVVTTNTNFAPGTLVAYFWVS